LTVRSGLRRTRSFSTTKTLLGELLDMSRNSFKTINTIDLDFCDEERCHNIVFRILSMGCCMGVKRNYSSFKGYHLRVFCRKDRCDLCRMVFDDQKRYAEDQKRPYCSRNVLFTRKLYLQKQANKQPPVKIKAKSHSANPGANLNRACTLCVQCAVRR
jgi:hypothetical protein